VRTQKELLEQLTKVEGEKVDVLYTDRELRKYINRKMEKIIKKERKEKKDENVR